MYIKYNDETQRSWSEILRSFENQKKYKMWISSGHVALWLASYAWKQNVFGSSPAATYVNR